MHRLIATNKFLHKIRQTDCPRCHNCEIYVETIEHLFYECLIIQDFWLDVASIWTIYFSKNVRFTCKDVLLGYDLDSLQGSELENLLILYVKYYIYMCKLSNRLPQTSALAQYIKSNVCIVLKTNCNNQLAYEHIIIIIIYSHLL